MKIEKLNIEEVETGVNLDVEGAPEGIHIEWEILPQVIRTLHRMNEKLTNQNSAAASAARSQNFSDAIRSFQNRDGRTAMHSTCLGGQIEETLASDHSSEPGCALPHLAERLRAVAAALQRRLNRP